GSLQNVAGSTERIIEILDTEPQIKDPVSPKKLPVPSLGTVALKNVTFTYGSEEPVGASRSYEGGKGPAVALVGPSGSGKSTTLSGLLRSYGGVGGSIEADGAYICEITASDLRQRFAYVEQEPTIFAGTIAGNI